MSWHLLILIICWVGVYCLQHAQHGKRQHATKLRALGFLWITIGLVITLYLPSLYSIAWFGYLSLSAAYWVIWRTYKT